MTQETDEDVETISECEDLCDRWVRWSGSFGWYFVIRYEGRSASRRAIWKCVSPNKQVVDVTLPRTVEAERVAKRDPTDRPREADLFLEHEEE